MIVAFYIASAVAIISTLQVITRTNAVHALLYLIVSLLSAAVIFYILGAPFIAALEVIIYAGAIMVLFIFVIMMLNLVPASNEQEKKWLSGDIWVGPSILTLILMGEFVYVLLSSERYPMVIKSIGPKEVGTSLFTDYIIGVEIAAMLLMAAIVGAYHLGKKKRKSAHRFFQDVTLKANEEKNDEQSLKVNKEKEEV